MRIEIVEVRDVARASRWQSRAAVISHLHDYHHRLGHQHPAPARKPQSFPDAQLADGGNEFAAPDWNAPAMLAGVHVDGDDAAERWLEQRQSARAWQIAEFADEIV